MKMPTKNLIPLFHATNYNSFLNMKQLGHIGLNLNDYKNMLLNISKSFKFQTSLIAPSIEKWMRNEDPTRSEYHGGVSFFNRFNSCQLIAPIYAKDGGEFKGSLINTFLKKIAIYNKISYNHPTFKKIRANIMDEFIGANSKPVILEFKLPIKLIANPEDINRHSEICTNEKVPIKYFVKYHYV